MKQKTFESSQGWFELTYPEHWTQFEEEGGIYLFMDIGDWKGNLRISAMRVEPKNSEQQSEELKKDLKDELDSKSGSRQIKLGDKEAIYWTREVEQDGGTLVIYNWTIGDKGTLLICSFAINKDKAEQQEIGRELEFVVKTLESIKVR